MSVYTIIAVVALLAAAVMISRLRFTPHYDRATVDSMGAFRLACVTARARAAR